MHNLKTIKALFAMFIALGLILSPLSTNNAMAMANKMTIGVMDCHSSDSLDGKDQSQKSHSCCVSISVSVVLPDTLILTSPPLVTSQQVFFNGLQLESATLKGFKRPPKSLV